jgi:3-isopropylmalate/(R)-2-methylmalate dehydratase large subunit
MATGQIWLRVPESLRLVVSGCLMDRVTPKDVALHIIGRLGADGANYRSVEFSGETVRGMGMAGRMVLTNMAAEMGAKNAVVEPDAKTREWLEGRVSTEYEEVRADSDAAYDRVVEFDVGDLAPQVARPHTVDNVVPVSEVVGTPINQGLIGTCTNGRLEDLLAAADILRGKHIAPAVRLLVLPASREVLLAAIEAGVVSDLVAAGATLLNPGCGPCLGAHEGCMAPGEVTLSTANRNFRGRMGSKEASIYLASPVTVAASALVGGITDPRTVS